jgi:hypothetical protein
MKNRYVLRDLLFVALFSVPFVSNTQILFSRLYATNYDKTSREVLPTGDGGYLIAGMTNNSDPADCDAYIIKTDNNGIMQWDKTFGGAKPDYPYSMIETTDGNFMIVGFSYSFGSGDEDIYLLKIDPSGAKIFEKKLGGTGNDEAREIVKTNDGNYVIVGTSTSFSGSQDAFLIKIDNSGTELWRKTYGGSGLEFGNGVALCADGGFIVTGRTGGSSSAGGQAYLVRTDASGNMTWSNSYGTALDDEGVAVVSNADGSYVMVVRDSTAASDIDVHVLKADAGGAKTWEKSYGGVFKDTPKRIRATNDGGYIVGAISRSFGWANPDMWLLKLDTGGDTLWSRHFGGSGHEHCHDIKQSSDGGYLAVGHSRSYSPYTQVYFLKLNGSGTVLVPELMAENSLMVYPNPTNGFINVISNSKFPVSAIKVSDMFGRLVFSRMAEELKPEEIKMIDITNEKPGVYFLTVISGNMTDTRKVVLR